MKKTTRKIIYINLLAVLILNITCQKLDPVSITKFSGDKMVATPASPNTASVTGKFMALGDDLSLYGHCWATKPSPTVADFKTANQGKPGKQVEFISQLTDLLPGTKYYVRVYAVLSDKTIYSDEINFTTPAPTVSVTTTAISAISNNKASSGGIVTADAGTTVTGRGICWGIATAPTIELSTKTSDHTGTGAFTSYMTGLTASTKYYVRAYASTSTGTVYGNEITFTTSATAIVLPSLTTTAITAITQTTATSGGNITSEGGAAVTARGVCFATTANPTISNNVTIDGTGTGVFTSSLTGLTAGTTYYVRAYAINSAGTAYGNQVSFVTPAASGTVTDIDGNLYHEVTIGTQTWMLENLKTTKYNDGTAISNVTDNTAWTTAGAAYCWYNNDAATYKATYGALYNWKAVDPASNGNKNICPTGWHVPTDAEWTILTTYLGGETVAGGKMKESGTAHWTTPNTGADNSSGFTALPGGTRAYNDGTFGIVGNNGHWWSNSANSTSLASDRGINYSNANAYLGSNSKQYGFSVRCLKGNPILLPTLTTTAITAITQTTATSGGNITSDGGTSVTSRGVCYGTTTNPTILNTVTVNGTGTGIFASPITGLIAGTTYYLRAYAINSLGTAYGNEITFTTTAAAVIPTLTTTAVTSITQTTASSGGNITSDGGAAVTSRGVCYGTTANPTIANSVTINGTGTGAFASPITGLTANTTYYVRAYAINTAGTAYGNEISFITAGSGIIFNPNLTYGSVSDNDGNTYKTIVIGTQEWMAENLKTTKYNDGTAITNVTDNTAWTTAGAAYCWYNNDAATYKATYGALYNWYAVDPTSNGNKNICPTGWHVPTDVEWTTLTTYLGGETVAGGKMKESGTTHWTTPNTGADNSIGFTGLPGGTRIGGGSFNIGINGTWWSSTAINGLYALASLLVYNSSDAYRSNTTKDIGFSVRCLKGNPILLPTLATTAISAITQTTASSGGNITSDGGGAVTSHGVCYGTTANPTILNSVTVNGTGTGIFASPITGLTAGTTYYLRAYAINSAGTAYGNQITFTTTAATVIPTLTTIAISAITQTTASSGGNATADGGAAITARGVCWGTATNPTVALTTKTSDGTGIGTFTSSIAGLTANTIYYVRAYATNTAGTAYGVQVSFTTSATLPTSGLVAYYPFNGNANDASGSGNNGTVNGAILTTDRKGNANMAYSFDGVSNYISIPDNNSLDFGLNDFSISIWLKYPSQVGGTSDYASILQKWISSTNSDGMSIFIDSPALGIFLFRVDGPNPLVSSSSGLDNNTFRHFVCIRQSNTLKVYINGVLDNSLAVPAIDISGTMPVILGAHALDTTGQNYQGIMDDLRIYNRALTASEIQSLYNE